MTGNEDIHKDFSADQCMGNLVKFISKFWNFHWRLVCQLSIIVAQISKTSGVLNVCFYRYLLSILTTYVKKNNPALEKVLTIMKDLKGVYIVGQQGWPSGESACLPPMCSGFDSGPVPYVSWWSLLLVLALLRGFFSGFSGFPSSTKTNNLIPIRPG